MFAGERFVRFCVVWKMLGAVRTSARAPCMALMRKGRAVAAPVARSLAVPAAGPRKHMLAPAWVCV